MAVPTVSAAPADVRRSSLVNEDTEMFLPGWQPPRGLYMRTSAGQVHRLPCEVADPVNGVCAEWATVECTDDKSGGVWMVCDEHAKHGRWRR